MGKIEHTEFRLTDAARSGLVDRLARALNANLTVAQVLERVLGLTVEVLQPAQASIMAVRGLTARESYVMQGDSPCRVSPGVLARVLDSGLAGHTVRRRETTLVADIKASDIWLALPDEPCSPQHGAAVGVPLVHETEIIGVMVLAQPSATHLTGDVLALLGTIAAMGAAAIARAMQVEARQRAEQNYADLLAGMPLPILVTDQDGRVQEANRAAWELLGYTRDELLDCSIRELHLDLESSLGLEPFAQLDEGREIHFSSALRSSAGETIPVQVRVRRLRADGDRMRLQWFEQVLSSQAGQEQLRRDLSAMVYHDMRGPLGNVHTSVQALNKLLADHPSQAVQSLLEVASHGEAQVRSMIDSLLDVQYLEEGRKLITRATVNLFDLLASTSTEFQAAASERNVEIQSTVPSDLPAVYVDAEMIRRVVSNLVDNAIKYCEAGGHVIISAASTGDEVFVRVKDDGPGIPAEAQASIFDKYMRVKHRNMPRGVGLGLAFCKLAVEAHGGRIWVRSDPENGSTFTFALPLNAPSTQELPQLGTPSST